MATFADFKAQIADDLDDQGLLTAQIDAAVRDAIGYYGSTRFYFNEARGLTFSTVAGQAVYTASDLAFIGDALGIDYAEVIQGGVSFRLERTDEARIDAMSTPTPSGIPALYSYFGRSLRLYPTPASVLTIGLQGHQLIGPPDGDVVENAWTLEAAPLIRARAKRTLALHVLRDDDMAARMTVAEKEALAELSARTSKMRGTGRIRAEYL